MNIVCLTGRLTKDPELKWANNKAVCRFTVAVDRPKEGADFVSCVAWDKVAESIDKYFIKGKPIAINGRIQTGSYKGKNGTVYTTDVIVNHWEFVSQDKTEKRNEQQDLPDSFAQFDVDIPF